MGSQNRAFTMIELAVVIGIVLLGFALLVQWLVAREKQRARSIRIACVGNLKQVGIGFRIWAGDQQERYPMQVYTNGSPGFIDYTPRSVLMVMSNELNTPKVLTCPADTRIRVADFTHLSNTNISYFVGLDALDNPPQMFLLGDRNITNGTAPVNGILTLGTDTPAGWTAEMHHLQGNVGLADGSVQAYSTEALRTQMQHTGDTTNRISLP